MEQKCPAEYANRMNMVCINHISLPDLEDIIKKHIAEYAKSVKIQNYQKASNYVEVQNDIAEIQWRRNRTNNWFVTINPKPEYQSLAKFRPLVDEFAKKFRAVCWTYEIRSDAKPYGLHCHMMLYQPMNRQTKNTVTNIKRFWTRRGVCGNAKHIDIKYVDNDQVQNTYDYMKKTNAPKSKKKANDLTILWRKKNKVPLLVYPSGTGEPSLTC